MAGWAVHYPVKLVSDPKICQRSIAEMKMLSHVLHRIIIADNHRLLPI